MNRELPGVQAGFRRDRGTRDQIANINWIVEKAKELQKNMYFCFVDYTKTFDYVDDDKLWKNLKEMGIPVSWETWMQVKKQQSEPDMKQRTGSKLGKYIKAVCIHPAYLTSMKNTSHEMSGCMNYMLESRLPGGISTTSDIQMMPL